MKVLSKAPPVPPELQNRNLPHGAVPMYVSVEEWLLLQGREHARGGKPLTNEDVNQWIRNWYYQREGGVMVDHGDQGKMIHHIISAYPEDVAYIEGLRKRKEQEASNGPTDVVEKT